MSYLKVLVMPGAKRERVEARPALGGAGESLVVAVKEPAQGNHANRRVREILAAREGVPLSQVRIVSGHHSRSKMLAIRYTEGD